MRPLETVLIIGVAVQLVLWASGKRSRWLPIALLVVAVAHLALEGPRLVMAIGYLVTAIAGFRALVRRSPSSSARRGVRAALRWIGAVAALVVVVAPPWLWPVMKLPSPTGPHPIGTTWIVVRDSTRPETRVPERGRIRELPVKVWYPAAGRGNGVRAPYADVREISPTPGLGRAFYAQLRHVATHAFQDAPIALGRFPVLVFSHGYGAFAAQNTVQMEELASQGYVIFSIAHPGEAGGVVFPDGRVVPMDRRLVEAAAARAKNAKELVARGEQVLKELGQAKDAESRKAGLRALLELNDEPMRTESVAQWALDTKVVVDQLERFAGGDGSSPFAGHLDLDRLGIFGMSYGGATAGEFCATDRRCKAALNLDGGQFGRLIDTSLAVPFFIMGGDQSYPIHVPVLDLARGPAYLLRVPETNHMGFSDATLLAPVLYRWTGATGKLAPDRREAIMTRYLLAFFDTYLKGRPSPLLDGPTAEFPEVQLTRRGPVDEVH